MRMLCAGGGMGGENGGVVKVPELKREKSMGWLNSEKADLLEEAMKKSLVHDLVDHNRESANQVVPWFLENMPEDYFNQLSKEVWYGHLRALNALFEMKESPDLLLKSPCDNFVTFIKSHNYTGLVDEMITELPKRKSPTHARLFTSVDCVLAINVFGYGEQKLAREEDIEERYLASMLTFLQNSGGPPEEHAHLFTEDAMRKYMSMCPSSYLNLCSPQRFIKQRIQYERVQGNELVDVKVSRNYLWHSRKDEDEKYTLLSIATHNHSPRVTLENFASYMASANLDIEFLYMDRILDTHESGHVDVLSILLKDPPNMHDKEWEEIRSDLERIKWVDTAALEAFNYSRTQATGLTLQQAEILSALCHMLHGQLNSGTMDITLDKMLTSVYGHYLAIAIDICSLFERRFHPTQGLTKQEEDLEYERISGRVSMVVEETMRTTLDKMLTVVKDARKTNLYVPQRKGLGISVNPANLSTPKHVAGLPYGVLFMHGRRSNLFHVRFREHSRGGMRVATPNSPQEYTLRSLNHYEEAYGLAATQHAKNKDIAEGGSKAVLLVRTHDYDDIKAMQTHQRVKQGANKNEEEQKILEEAKTARDGLIFRSVRMAADSLLDLIIPDPELEKYIKRTPEAPEQEFVYLGPDEQITPTHINWITDQAKLRHLPYATAFMSSKPLSGINHKEYGVTSEGVCIFLDVALRNMGKDPTERPFTLKITGGTSGDVAGNAIKILNRDYGENAKIVGIVDHKGCCEDPSGLDLTELMRLVNNELSLEHFDESKLSSDGKFWSRDNPEGVVMCDSMHNRLQTDAFLPAGGLPNTIRTDNWEAFLTEDGSPSAPLIVEAANIFIEQQARVKLTEKGVLIVKDSSANKCGVICSAMEIIAHLLMSEGDFMDFRSTYVDDVLEHLRTLASKEATIMFDEYKKGDGSWETSLPGIAERISRVMNYSSDHIANQIQDCLDQPHILQLASSALLPSLREKAGDSLSLLPPGYIINMVAKHLSSQLVYHEGLDYVERSIPQDKFAMVAVQYAEETKRVSDMVDVIAKADIASGSKEEITELLRLGGPRIAVSRSKVFAPKAE